MVRPCFGAGHTATRIASRFALGLPGRANTMIPPGPRSLLLVLIAEVRALRAEVREVRQQQAEVSSAVDRAIKQALAYGEARGATQRRSPTTKGSRR